MAKGYSGIYQKLVYVAYSFYLVLGLAWFLMSLLGSGRFNIQAFVLMSVFAAQFYYKHLLTNLITGIICLFLSIIMLLQSLNMALQGRGKENLVLAEKLLITIPVVSMLMSGILIFSFLKLNFRDKA